MSTVKKKPRKSPVRKRSSVALVELEAFRLAETVTRACDEACRKTREHEREACAREAEIVSMRFPAGSTLRDAARGAAFAIRKRGDED